MKIWLSFIILIQFGFLISVQAEPFPSSFKNKFIDLTQFSKKQILIPEFYLKYSNLLGITLIGNENKRLITAVGDWLGTPYQWGGCSENGIDCSCFVKSIFQDVYNVALQRTSIDIYHTDITPVQKNDLQEGDIVCFKTDDKAVSHIGIYLKNNKFAHAAASQGVMINNLKQRYFKDRFIGAGRVSKLVKKKYLPVQLKVKSSIVLKEIRVVKSIEALLPSELFFTERHDYPLFPVNIN